MSHKISAVIITKDEEANIERCLLSLDWVDEIVVVDSGSKDNTLAIAQKFDCRIINTEWLGFGPTKKLAVNSAQNDWVLSIDADEEVTPELKEEIKNIFDSGNLLQGYRIKWLSFYLNKWIKHSGWNRNFKLKLFNRKYGNFNDAMIHEKVLLNGKIGRLKSELKHYTYPDLKTVMNKTISYADIGARGLAEKNKSPSLYSAYFHGASVFIKLYFLNLGFLDGRIGIVLATNYAFAAYLKYLRYWEMNFEKEAGE